MSAKEREIYTLRVGLRNKDYRPGPERQEAERRLRELTGHDRVRYMIPLRGKR